MALSTPVNEIVKQSSDSLLGKHDSWERVQLADLAEVLNGFAFKSSAFSKERGTPIIRIRDVDKDSTDTLYDGPYEERYVIEAGDLLIGMDGDFNSGRWRGPKALLNQRVCKVELKSEHYSLGFLEHILPGYLKAINDKTSAVTVKHLSSKSVAEIPLPLPPFNEQRRIVDKIEELFTKLDAGVRSLKQTHALLKSYRRSVLKAAVEGELSREWREAHRDKLEPASELLEQILQERREKFTGKKYREPASPDPSELPALSDEWEWATVDQLTNVGTGATPLKSNRAYYRGGSIPWVTSGALNDLFIRDCDQTITEVALKETNAKLFPKHTLLVAMYGEGKTRGKVSELLIEAATNQACAALTFSNLSKDCRSYVKLFLQKNYDDIRRLSAGGVQPNLNLSIVKLTAIPLPPLEEQRFIVEEVERRLSVVDKLEATVEASLKQAASLRQSILKRAFSGELVPQDPDDEPASVLLERIGEERQVAKPKASKGRKGNSRPTASGPVEQIELFDNR